MVEFGPYKLLADTSGDCLRQLIPAAYHGQVFDAFHGTAHPGARATKRLIGQRVVWKYMAVIQ